MSSPGNPMS
jgi:hypothetical protein